MRLDGKRAIITGGAGGIGSATARRFIAEGAVAAIVDKNGEAGERLAAELSDLGGKASFFCADVTSGEAITGAIGEAAEFLGGVDALVGIAGRAQTEELLDIEPDQWRADVELNLTSHYHACRAVLPRMIDCGGGSIVNVATVNAVWCIGQFGYSAAKAGLVSLTRNIAVVYGGRGVRANAICPGTIDTARGASYWDERAGAKEKLLKWYPVGRLGEADDVAHLAVYLASDESSFMSGAVLMLDGGLTAGSSLFGEI